MLLQRHRLHGGPLHQQSKLLPDEQQRQLNRQRWGRLCGLEVRHGRDAEYRRRGRRAGVLQLGQRAAGGPDHVGLFRDAT